MRTITSKTILVLNLYGFGAGHISEISFRNRHRNDFRRRFGLGWLPEVNVDGLRIAAEIQRIVPEPVDVIGLIRTED